MLQDLGISQILFHLAVAVILLKPATGNGFGMQYYILIIFSEFPKNIKVVLLGVQLYFLFPIQVLDINSSYFILIYVIMCAFYAILIP